MVIDLETVVEISKPYTAYMTFLLDAVIEIVMNRHFIVLFLSLRLLFAFLLFVAFHIFSNTTYGLSGISKGAVARTFIFLGNSNQPPLNDGHCSIEFKMKKKMCAFRVMSSLLLSSF